LLSITQRTLFCWSCGAPPAKAGLCLSCYARTRRSVRYFAGHHDFVLARDRHYCRGCGEGNQRTVHHRRPGVHDPTWLVTICPACHAAIHKLGAHRRWLPPTLVELWQEQHPAAPLQLQLAIEESAPPLAERAAA